MIGKVFLGKVLEVIFRCYSPQFSPLKASVVPSSVTNLGYTEDV